MTFRTHTPRISMEDTALEIAIKMSGGNPGAMTVLMELLLNNAAIDPDSMLGQFGSIFTLDSLGIYESDIWILYKDICKQNITHTIAVLRAVQLGMLLSSELLAQLKANVPALDVDGLYKQVVERLPAFDPENREMVASVGSQLANINKE